MTQSRVAAGTHRLPAAAESIKEVLGFAGAHRAPAEGGREEQGPDAYWRRHFEIVYGLHAMRDVQPSTGSCLAAPKLELRGVSKAFPGVRALTDVSLSIWPGETHMVLGEALVQIAGAGKRPVLYCRNFKLGARHSTLQAQVDLGHPDVPVRIVPCGCDASIRYRRS